jgi:hypothetical protein
MVLAANRAQLITSGDIETGLTGSLGVRQLNFLWKLQCADPVSHDLAGKLNSLIVYIPTLLCLLKTLRE